MPVRNGAGTIPALLHSLARQTVARRRFEVIVVDNGSSDATSVVAQAHGARVVHEPIPSRARARNRGAEAAGGALYAFTDADCRADPGWLEALLGCADRAPLVAGEVRVRVSESPNAVERFEALWRFGQEAWVREQGWAATANLLVRADAFHAIGGFDPAWRHIGEDADLCLRARDAGFLLGYCAEAVIDHYAERDIGPLLRRCFLHGYSANQAFHRIGVGHRAWRDPVPALVGDRALRQFGHWPAESDATELRAMVRLARLGYMARIVGSVWAELSRAR